MQNPTESTNLSGMKINYCLRCAREIAHVEPRICQSCAAEIKPLFARDEWVLVQVNFDQACVSCGEYSASKIIHGPGEFTWCEACIDRVLQMHPAE